MKRPAVALLLALLASVLGCDRDGKPEPTAKEKAAEAARAVYGDGVVTGGDRAVPAAGSGGQVSPEADALGKATLQNMQDILAVVKRMTDEPSIRANAAQYITLNRASDAMLPRIQALPAEEQRIINERYAARTVATAQQIGVELKRVRSDPRLRQALNDSCRVR